MTDRPVLFSAPMVRALLAGTKTQTRRVVKPQPIGTDASIREIYGKQLPAAHKCPYGQPGDRLWVRENGWERPDRTPKMLREGADTWAPYYYDADYEYGATRENQFAEFKEWGFKRRPSIHMPRWASRITLEIVSVRVERLQEISDEDAIAEGMPIDDAWYDYMRLWEKINGAGRWEADPWVWVVGFKRVQP